MTDNQESTSAKLRSIRKSKGWSLQEVEKLSRGKWKAVVIGSYERGDRAISLKKSIELMNFYQVPITALFTQNVTAPVLSKSSNLILDQRRISESSDIQLIGIKRMINYICAKRRDWNGEVLSLRSDDLNFLALMLDKSPEATLEYLGINQYLLK
jgi:transcriptional regulator with XRE-family HTH domain